MHLDVRESNAAARALYARFGFAEVGRRRAYYREPVEDALVLRCDLPATRRTMIRRAFVRWHGGGPSDILSPAMSFAICQEEP